MPYIPDTLCRYLRTLLYSTLFPHCLETIRLHLGQGRGKREIGGETNAFDRVAALDGELIEFLSSSDAGLRCEGVQLLPIHRAQMKTIKMEGRELQSA